MTVAVIVIMTMIVTVKVTKINRDSDGSGDNAAMREIRENEDE